MEPAVSIIITAHDNARELERNLPAILAQDYPGDYQVIVVGEKGELESEDILKRLSAENSRLYFTQIPESSRYMSRKKLQITLGVKAAKHEWVLLTDATCQPQDDQWLKTMAANCTDDVNLVMGYVALDGETAAYRRFEHVYNALPLFRRAARKTAWRTNCQNLMFRKSEFIARDGFRGNLHLLRGEYDFLVNKYAEKQRTAVELSSEAWLVEEEPTAKEWRNRHIYYQATRKELRRSFLPRFWFNAKQLLNHLCLWAVLAVAAYGIIMEDWTVAGIGGGALLVLYLLKAFILKRQFQPLDEEAPTLLLPFFEISLIWRNLSYMVHYWRAEKTDFTSHKL